MPRARCAGRVETGLQVGLEVVDVLDADREPHEAGRDARRELLLGGQLGVGCRRGVDDEAAHVADVGKVAEQYDALDEGATGVDTALELE
jgi:hypothetical protein